MWGWILRRFRPVPQNCEVTIFDKKAGRMEQRSWMIGRDIDRATYLKFRDVLGGVWAVTFHDEGKSTTKVVRYSTWSEHRDPDFPISAEDEDEVLLRTERNARRMVSV